MRAIAGAWQLHMLLLSAWMIAFALLPSWLTGIPASHLLSSDAEYYAAVTQALASPAGLPSAGELAVGLLPSTERAVLALLGRVPQALGLALLDAWVAYEIAAAITFALALYAMLVYATRSRLIAAAATFVASLGVHALGGSIFGFEPRGFIPRDLALAIAVILVLAYVRLTQRRGKAAVFLVAGIAANAYAVLFAHLVAVLLLAELFTRGLRVRALILFGLLAAAGAAPTVVDVLTSRVGGAPPDQDIYRIRESYLLVTPVASAVTQYLRRPLVAFVVVFALYVICRGRWTDDERDRVLPFFGIAFAGALVATIGIVLEQGSSLARLLLSRTSVFVILASLPICLIGLPIALRQRFPRAAGWGVALAFALFALQSNVLTDVRSLNAAVADREERRDLIKAAAKLAVSIAPSDMFIAPSDESMDIAASLRTYADRAAYATYKDLGIVLYDGDRARDAYARWIASESALRGDRAALLEFMRTNGVRAAVIRSAGLYEVVSR